MSKSLFTAVSELITLYDEAGCQFTDGVRMALNALRPYTFDYHKKWPTHGTPSMPIQTEMFGRRDSEK